MDQETRNAWILFSLDLWAHAVGREPRESRFAVGHPWHGNFPLSLAAFVRRWPDSGEWTEAAFADLDARMPTRRHDLEREGHAWGHANSARKKCVRLGYALATGRRDGVVFPSEAGFLDSAPTKGRPVEAEPSAAPSGDVPPAGGSFAVSFGFSARLPTAKGRRMATDVRLSSACTFEARAEGVATVVRHAGRADVAFVLPDAEGRPATSVVEVDGRLFRPLLSSRGTFVHEAEFVRLAAGDDPWQDCPFRPNLDRGSAMALAEYARTHAPRDESERLAIDEARADALRSCGRLLSIGGVIHRETGEPTLHVALLKAPESVDAAHSDGRPVVSVCWRLPDLSMEDGTSTVRTAAVPVDWDTAKSSAGKAPWRPSPSMAFPYSMSHDAQKRSRAYAEDFGLRHVEVPYAPRGSASPSEREAVFRAQSLADAEVGRPDAATRARLSLSDPTVDSRWRQDWVAPSPAGVTAIRDGCAGLLAEDLARATACVDGDEAEDFAALSAMAR